MKQTAVEWFSSEIRNHIEMPGRHFEELLEQAKQMEKEQIVDAFRAGGVRYSAGVYPEQYYNETFKSEIITDINLDENDIKKINDYVKNETFKSE